LAPHDTATATTPLTERELVHALQRFASPDWRRSLGEIAVTAALLAVLWAAAWWALSVSWLLTLLIAIPAAGMLVRLFLIQHDCGHGAFFEGRGTNDWIGRALGVLTLTPYDVWRRAHALHHASSGNLDRRGIGDLNTLTIAEYRALSAYDKLLYRLYRNPIVMFVLGPAWLFLLAHRIPTGALRKHREFWVSAMATNAAIAAFAGLMIWAVGPSAFLKVHLPIVVMAASIGVWLFYVQHQFEETYWADSQSWALKEAALHGSSHYDLPQPLRWISANIGVHHVHHLMSRIPFYRLPDVLAAHPHLADLGRITLWESFRTVRLKLWDEENRRLVSFREARI
jgi:omega-6 fatty acid desaturase (delta-12 desaturase)